MRKILSTLVLGLTALILLAAVALGLLLATFNPNSYKPYFSEAVEKATGRQLIFHGNVEMSFFPVLGLKTGKLTLNDAGPFGDEPFLSVDGASVAVALEPLFKGMLEVRDLSLRGPALKLATNAAGLHNWEYGFARERTSPAAPEQGVAAPLETPGEKEDARKTESFALFIKELSCSDLTVFYRDMRSGARYSGKLDDFSLSGLGPGADMPAQFSGRIQDEQSGRKLSFSLKALLRAPAWADLSADIEALNIEAEGLAAAPLRLEYAGGLRYARAEGRLLLENARGVLALPSRPGQEGAWVRSVFHGRADYLPGQGAAPPALNADLTLEALDADALLSIFDTPAAVSVSGAEARGAPNLPRPKVSSPKKKPAPNAGEAGGLAALAALKADVNLSLESLTLAGLPLRSLRLQLRSHGGRAELPFSLELFGGTVSGKALADLRGAEPSFTLNAQARGLNMENATRTLSGKYTVTGRAAAALDVSGKGASAASALSSLKGKASAEAVNGEVRGFKLIPGDLPNFKAAPESFPYQRMAASATISQGVASSKDITLASAALTARGGGTAQLAQGQADLGIDFMLAGLPPAVPVTIHGPFSSLSCGVDMRTFLRNVAESAVRSPEELLRRPGDAKGLIRQVGGQLFRQ